MELTTPVKLPVGQMQITHRHRIMAVGSCFAANMGERLCAAKFDCVVNPCGVLYNPLSIAASLEWAAEGRTMQADDEALILHDGRWHSLMHHGDFSAEGRDELLQNVNRATQAAHRRLQECDLLVVTLGSAIVYRHLPTGRVAGNCHKLPGSLFERRLIGVDEAAAGLLPIVARLCRQRPSLRVLFTVSPIRHIKEGATQNLLSKSTLLLALHAIMRELPGRCFYFPAYEIMMDELRDYRFYAQDMTHPSPLAVDYLWERFAECYFAPETRQIVARWQALSRSLAHRPMNAESDEYRSFRQRLGQALVQMQNDYPYINLKNEIEQCTTA